MPMLSIDKVLGDLRPIPIVITVTASFAHKPAITFLVPDRPVCVGGTPAAGHLLPPDAPSPSLPPWLPPPPVQPARARQAPV